MLKIANETDQRSAEAYAFIFLGFCLGAKGDYTRALEFGQSGLEIAEEIEHQQWMTAAHCVLGVTYRDLLELSIARQHLEQALSLANEPYSFAECVRFEQESFGALHQMLAGLNDAERKAAWEEIEQELSKFEGPDGFEGPCEMVVAIGVK